jgi:hypothetical protein
LLYMPYILSKANSLSESCIIGFFAFFLKQILLPKTLRVNECKPGEA